MEDLKRKIALYVTQSVSTSIPAQIPKSGGSKDLSYVKVSKTDRERFEMWFVGPLNRMGQNDGFVLMCALFPLYERYLRKKLNLSKTENFSKGHKVFKEIAKNLKISKKEAFQFWQIFRNGALHLAFPKKNYVLQYSTPKAVEFNDDWIFVNPIGLRETLMPMLSHKLMWKGMKIPEIYKPL